MPPKKGVKQGPRKSLEEKFYSKTIVGAAPLGLDTDICLNGELVMRKNVPFPVANLTK